jgi:preprotein translocase subunit SecF
MKKYLTEGNLIIALLVLGIGILVIVVFFPSKKNSEELQLLKGQQHQIEDLRKQLQQADVENRSRDSILLDAYIRNAASREASLQKSKQTANEKIDHINSPGFNNDSIRRAFSN